MQKVPISFSGTEKVNIPAPKNNKVLFHNFASKVVQRNVADSTRYFSSTRVEFITQLLPESKDSAADWIGNF